MSGDPSEGQDSYNQCIYHAFIGRNLEDDDNSRAESVADYVKVMTHVWNVFTVLHIINLVVTSAFCIYFIFKKHRLSGQRWR